MTGVCTHGRVTFSRLDGSTGCLSTHHYLIIKSNDSKPHQTIYHYEFIITVVDEECRFGFPLFIVNR